MLGIIIMVVIAWYFVSTKNNFNELQNSIKHEGSNIGIQIEKRSKCLDDALNIVKLGYEKEVAGIEKLTANDRLERLAFLGQKYPELQTMTAYQHAMAHAIELDKDISAAKELLNGNILAYNTAITNLPGCWIAKMFHYEPEAFLDEENYRENIRVTKKEVDFSNY